MRNNVLQIATLFILLLSTVSKSYAQTNDSIALSNIVSNLYAETTPNDSTATDTIPTEPPFRIDTLGCYQMPFIDSLICYAESFLGKPYRYGSKGPDSFDCSGFTGFVFSHFGIQLPSSSTYQYKEAPRQFSDICQAQQGDLIFFMGRNGRKSVGHVGLIVDVDTTRQMVRFIHAATHGGIIETNYPSHAYYNQRFMDFGRYSVPEYVLFYDTRKIYLSDSEPETSEKTSDGE